MQKLTVNGFEIHKSAISLTDQTTLRNDIRRVAQAAPMGSPVTPGGRKMSVRMTSAGRCGWRSDKSGYRYARVQSNGAPWPDMPAGILSIWTRFSGVDRAPDSCLVNFYGADAKMGLHQDKDEGGFDWPVVSISLGDDALFRMGGPNRNDPTSSVWLSSGDVVVMGGAARRAFHGIDRIKFGSSRLLSAGGRLNITLRVVETAKQNAI
jgi:alkylated DNA repair protein (DNA oxidative demethylase)